MTVQKSILVVDDVEVNRRILSRILQNDGFHVVEAENGQAALDILKNNTSEICLMLLDLTMPVMDGYALMSSMKEAGLLAAVPVIVTTGNNQDDAEVKSLECGASDFITKPYKPDIVCHRVRSILRLCENAALLGRLETDRVTGLYNREFFYLHAEAVLNAHPGEFYDILCSNIENFKLINAKYGTAIGDKLLQSIAGHILECVGPEGVCGRLGADAFVALRKHIPPRSQADIGKLDAQAYKDAPVKSFVIQYGLYPVVDRSRSVPEMCDCAQMALATIKHKYGVHYAVYDDSMRQKFMREHHLSDTMERALAEAQFQVYLQPKHEIGSGAIAGAEALVRWVHPELGFISPGEFIPLFERNGFIVKLDRYMWEAVCAILQKWIAQGREPIPISVNASRMDFDDADLPQRIGEMVDAYGVPPELLHFEVTESAYTDNPRKIIAAISTLRDMGFLIEMDDFGSGYSSLNMLSELPIDLLKLDMRFVQNDGGLLPTGKRSILSFIVSLSKWLHLPTIAEGVETKEDVELLRAMGCNYIQGYYFAKPMPVPEFETYMEQYARQHPAATPTRPGAPRRKPLETDAGKRPLVLVVEDIAGNRELIANMLEPAYTVAMACDGQAAFEYVSVHHAEIACMLLDLLMPVMDGFELLDLMREAGYLEEIPVIITSEEARDSELRALHLGADSFVAKPYNEEILLHHVQKAVNEREYRKLLGKEKAKP